MFCKFCGKESQGGFSFCPNCGTNQNNGTNPQKPFSASESAHMFSMNNTVNTTPEYGNDEISFVMPYQVGRAPFKIYSLLYKLSNFIEGIWLIICVILVIIAILGGFNEFFSKWSSIWE